MFGVSSSGKTCFLYAMAQVLRNGVRNGDTLVQVISNRAHQQVKLNNGYLKLIQREWPKRSDKTELFDFKVCMSCNGYYDDVIPTLEIMDYRGGILQNMSEHDKELEKLLDSFRGSSAIIFIIDGDTLLKAMEPDSRDPRHRGKIDLVEQFDAKAQIGFVENIFLEYKRVEEDIPPIIIAISKGDLFATQDEKRNGIKLIKEQLPSLFSIGSQVTAAITVMSLGKGLGTDANGRLIGHLQLNADSNIYVPVIYGIYADLCYQYEETTDNADKKGILALLSHLRRMFADKVELYISGRRAIEV